MRSSPYQSATMFNPTTLLTTLLLASTCLATPTPSSGLEVRQGKTPFFILVGDSTTAPIQPWKGNTPPGGGGWGDGFLKTLEGGASGINLGKNGQTTVSYRENGWWKQVVAKIGEKVGGNDVSFAYLLFFSRGDGGMGIGRNLLTFFPCRFGFRFSLGIMIRRRRRGLVLRSMKRIWRRWCRS